MISKNLMHTKQNEDYTMNSIKQIALKRVHTLFQLAKEIIHKDPKLAQRYVKIARMIAMRTKIRLPKEYRIFVCKKCKNFILPGVNCRIRVQQRREPHMVITCLNCGGHSRIPIKSRENHC